MTVPNMNEIHSFMSENGPRNGFHMLSIWKMKLATWRPSWTKNSKRGYVHQWVTIDNVHAWPRSGNILKYWDLTTEMYILRNPKLALWRPYWIRPKFYLKTENKATSSRVDHVRFAHGKSEGKTTSMPEGREGPEAVTAARASQGSRAGAGGGQCVDLWM